MPLAIVGSLILSSEWAFKEFGCTTYGKEFAPCLAYGIDIAVFLGIGMFWSKIALPVAWFISVPWFLYLALLQVEAWWKVRRKKNNQSA